MTRIPGYEIQGELGRGGMATVYRAVQLSLSRSVALKVLAPHLANDPVDKERFLREARFAANLHHPHIVEIYDVGEADGTAFMAMAYEPGGTAAAVDGTVLAPDAALRMVRDIAGALDYAHQQGVVHRDVKPENILLRKDGSCVLTDFGIALSATQLSGLTHAGTSIGTPQYMSPEQLRGEKVDGRADLYSLGVVLYQMLTGELPYQGTDGWAVGMQHIQADIPRLPPELAHLQALIDSLLAKQLGARPQTGAELVRRIDALLNGSMSTPTFALPSAPAALRSPRGKRWLAPAAILAATVAVGVYMSTHRPQQPAIEKAGAVATQAPAKSPGYDLYLRGKVRVSSENREDNDSAISALQQAVAADPNLAAAHAELARAYTIKAFYFAPDSERKQLNEHAEVSVDRALALDPRSAEGLFARGLMLWSPSRRFPHEQAVRAYQQALAVDPSLDEAHHQLGVIYFHVGLFDRAQAELEKALAINPGNTLARYRLGVIAMYRGDYERAYAIFNSTPLERNPALWAFQTATVLFRLGRTREATQMIDKFLREFPADEGGVGHSVRAMMLAKAGSRAGAEMEIATAVRVGKGFGHFHHTEYNVASAYALMGNHLQAVKWLRTAAEDGFPCYPLFASDTQLDSLRSDKDFVALMHGLERDWKERKKSF